MNDIPVLAVDLDGTLLNSDLLYESFWAASKSDAWTPIRCLTALRNGGRPALKEMLAQRAALDVETLPYNQDVIDHIVQHRAKGGKTALVTASNQALAEEIAAHLEIFDEVHGSDGQTNLKGRTKADFLNSHFGKGQYIYAGDSSADLEVWPDASEAIAVRPSKNAAAALAQLDLPVVTLNSSGAGLKDYLKAIRPHQWLKNVLVFLPMIAAHDFAGATVWGALMAFITFSMVASSAYVVNDLLDLSADRAHPRKCQRPFAAGRIPIAHGGAMFAGLLGFGLLFALLYSAKLFLVVLLYFILTTAYSFVLKRMMVIDICTLAGLYTMRIIAGAVASELTLSVWILAFSIFFFFSLAAVKRQAELHDNLSRKNKTVSGRGYMVDDLPIVASMAVSSGYGAVLVMALYIDTMQQGTLYSTPEILWGICCVLLYWISRTIMLAHRGQMNDDPVIYAAKDGVSHICFLLIVCCILGSTFF